MLSLAFVLFAGDALISLLDSSVAVLSGSHPFNTLNGLLFFCATASGLVVYALMAFTGRIPKRWFLPIALFNVGAMLAVLPVMIYAYHRTELFGWLLSLCQVGLAVAVFPRLRGGWSLSWPLVAQERLQGRGFSWSNLSLFLLVNVLVVFPGALAYLGLCTALALGHFSEGFLTLHPSGLTVQSRKYVRWDGKTVQLVPMAHVGDPGFYRKVTSSFPTNALVLMEGVTDERHLLTNSIAYHRMAKSLHLAEQQTEFKPVRSQMVWADLDVAEFSSNTIGFLNLAMLLHSKGLNSDTLMKFAQFSPPPGFEEQLLEDVLHKRNRRLLQELQTQLPDSEHLVVPWGVAHMPQLAHDLQKLGFKLAETRDYQVIHFGSGGPR